MGFNTVLHTGNYDANTILEAEIPASRSERGSRSRRTAASTSSTSSPAVDHNESMPSMTSPHHHNDQLRSRPTETANANANATITTASAAASSPSIVDSRHQQQHHHTQIDFGNQQHVMMGLTIAGVASSMLTTIFGLFHVDVFLRAYELPLPVYSLGSFFVSMINTANDVAGAWLVDHVALTMPRSDLIGRTGCAFALLFLTPFFRWPTSASAAAAVSASTASNSNDTAQSLVWDGLHFVTTMSLYDTLSSFTTMLLGSVVTDNHSMTDSARVQFMASGKVVNLFASFAVARMGLAIFAGAHEHEHEQEHEHEYYTGTDNDTDNDVNVNVNNTDDDGYYNLTQFRIFLTLLAGFCGILFVVAQAMILGNGSTSGGGGGSSASGSTSVTAILRTTTRNLWRRSDNSKRNDDYDATVTGTATSATDTGTSATGTGSSSTASAKKRKLHWRRVLQDFWRHDNFRAWIGMEMLLEAQNTFCITFLKTFVDQLILRDDDQEVEVGGIDGTGGLSRGTCDWLLSMIGPMTQIVAIGTYIPIRKLGYPRVYSILFGVNIVLSLLLVTLANESSTYLIIAFLCVYPVLTGAVLSAGFHLAMSDMVMEMKRKHAIEGRFDEPSLAGLFMGANALVCKPMQSILPILTATVLNRGDESNQKQNLFYLLVLPPLICSCLQLLAWRRFDLTPKRTVKMRDELKKLDGGTNLLV
jgi:hypothetical protein